MKTSIKIERIRVLIDRLEAGEQVTPRDLRALLSKEDLNELKLAWDEEKAGRGTAKPAAIKKYEKLLQTACSYYGLMEKYSSELSRNTFLAQEFRYKSDNAFEQAIEYIREAEDRDADIALWLDRDVYGDISFEPASIPRVIGSRNQECQDKRKYPYPIQTKRELKIQVLNEILNRMTREHEKDSLEPFMTNFQASKSRHLKPPSDFTGFVF